MYQASNRFFLPVTCAFKTVNKERETLVSEVVDVQSSAWEVIDDFGCAWGLRVDSPAAVVAACKEGRHTPFATGGG